MSLQGEALPPTQGEESNQGRRRMITPSEQRLTPLEQRFAEVVVAAAPPLTEEQIAVLRPIFRRYPTRPKAERVQPEGGP